MNVDKHIRENVVTQLAYGGSEANGEVSTKNYFAWLPQGKTSTLKNQDSVGFTILVYQLPWL